MDNSLSLPVVPKGQDTKTEKSGVDKPQEKPNEKLADKVVENLHKEKDVAKLAMPKTKNLGGDGTFKGLDKEIDKGMARTIDVLVDKGLSKFGFKNSLEKKRDQENQNQIKVKKELLEVQLNKLDQQRKGRAREQKNEIRLAILQNIDEKRGRRRQTKTTLPGASQEFQLELDIFLMNLAKSTNKEMLSLEELRQEIATAPNKAPREQSGKKVIRHYTEGSLESLDSPDGPEFSDVENPEEEEGSY